MRTTLRCDQSHAVCFGLKTWFGLKETGCKAGRPILSAIVDTDDANEDELGMIDRDYGDESRFIVLDRTFESFARVWDQNHQYGYLAFASWATFQLSMTCLLDPYATYLLILSDGLDLGELTKFSKATWVTQGVFRVFFMLEERIYTFDPFTAIGPREYGVLKELRNFSDIPRIPQADFKGYPLRVDRFRTTFSHTLLNKEGKVIDFIGADAEASRVVTRALNLTPNFLPPDKDQFGFKLPNGSFNGVLGRLSRRESDIVFVGYFIKDYFTRDTEFTAGIYVDELCCLVRKASRIPEYLLPITIFPADLWGLLFLMGIICATTWIIIRTGIKMKAVKSERRAQKTPLAYLFNLSNTIRDAPLYRKLIQIVVDTYILLVSAPYRRFTRSGVERLMLFGLMLVSLIFVSMFQSSLSSVFLHPMFYKDIDSLQRLDESGIKIPVKYKGFMDDVFPANYSSMMDSLRNKMIYEPEQDEAAMLDRVAQSPKIAFVTRKSLVPLDDAIYIAKKQVIVVPECPRLYNLAYVVPRHSVLLEAINVVILRLLNGGLIEQWINVMNFNATMRDLALYRNVDDEKFKILTMNDLQFPFYLWAIGLILSSIIFIAERMHYRLVISNRIEMF
ncbi:AAEL015078-PA [Aedes aegypti]|uniref:AAEL015078-PA n=1 Tax=Aedes aegypti TaxID=7159 RepID=Q16EP1_AEDAE|nr:AAEL015078-PA [Aedes aegypti]